MNRAFSSFASRGALALIGWAGLHAPHLPLARAEPVMLYYSADPSCPDDGWVQAELKRRTAGVDLDGSVARVLVGPGREARYHGKMTLNTRVPDQPLAATSLPPDWSRELEGNDCRSVILALLTSLTIRLDILALDRDQPGDLTSPEPGQPSAVNVALDPPTSAGRSNAAPNSASEASSSAPERDDESTGWLVALVGGGHLRSGLTPRLDWSGSAGVSFEGVGEGFRALGVSVSINSSGPLEAETYRNGDEAIQWRRSWWTASSEVCPWGLGFGRRTRFRPCAAAHVGRYQAGLVGQDTLSQPFSFAAVGGQVEAQTDALVGHLHAGVHFPVQPVAVESGDIELYKQTVGIEMSVVLGLVP